MMMVLKIKGGTGSKDFTPGIFQARRIHLACVYERYNANQIALQRAGKEA